MNLEKLILVFGAMWAIQLILTFIQMKHYRKTVAELAGKYSGFLGVGVAKKRFGISSIVILVTNFKGDVIDAREMTGVTVFQRFKPVQSWIGEKIEKLKQGIPTDNRSKALHMAIERIEEQWLKHSAAI